MKPAVYPPLALLNRTAAAHLDVWKIVAKLYGLRGTDNVPYWPKWCYAPLSAAPGDGSHASPRPLTKRG